MSKAPTRRGVPLTVYFDTRQMEQLNRISRQRHVAKAELLRLAVDLLFEQINHGQLQLQLGVQLNGGPNL